MQANCKYHTKTFLLVNLTVVLYREKARRYILFGEALLEEHSATRDMPYLFNGKERDEETGLLYFGARYYDPDGTIWYGVDPMAAKYPNIGGYVYCAANPVRFIDPDGQNWVEREVDGITETYYDRDVQSQADVNKKYGENSGVKHLNDGTKVGNGQYTVYNDHKNNKNGYVTDQNGSRVNNDRTIQYGDNYTIFSGTTDNSVNAETLHKNLFGTSYTGGNNPQDYSRKDNFDYIPRNSSELWSIIHDKMYGDLGAKGAKGAFLDISTWKADGVLAGGNLFNMIKLGVPLKDRGRSAATAALFGTIAYYKGLMTLYIKMFEAAGKGASAIKP